MYAYRSWLLAGTLLASGATSAIAESRVDAAGATWGGVSDCDRAEVSTQLVRPEGNPTGYVNFTYRRYNDCNSTIIGSGTGMIPRAAFTGSISSGAIAVVVNVASVPGYNYSGRAFSGRIAWAPTTAIYERTTTVGYVARNGTRVDEVRRVNVYQSASVGGVNNITTELGSFSTARFDLSSTVDFVP